MTALSGSETTEIAYALESPCVGASAPTPRCSTSRPRPRSTRSERPSPRSGKPRSWSSWVTTRSSTARRCSTSGSGRRAAEEAEIVTIGARGSVPAPLSSSARARRPRRPVERPRQATARLRSRGARLVGHRRRGRRTARGGGSRARLRGQARVWRLPSARPAERARCRRGVPPRRTRTRSSTSGSGCSSSQATGGSRPGRARLAERSDAVIAITMFHSPAVGWAGLVLPRPPRSSARGRR